MIQELGGLMLVVSIAVAIYQTMKSNAKSGKYDADQIKVHTAMREVGEFVASVQAGVESGNLLNPDQMTLMGKEAGEALDSLEAVGPGVARIIADVREAAKA